MDWEAPAIVLDARPYGESGAIVTVMTEALGLHRGLARGGGSRAQASLWQPGNLAQVRWVARLADQLGSFSGELVYAGAAQIMDEPLPLAILAAVCAVAEGALPEREPHPNVFAGLLRLIAHLPQGAPLLADLVQLGTGAAGGTRLRPGPDALRGQRRNRRAGLRIAEDRPSGHGSGGGGVEGAAAAAAGLPGRRQHRQRGRLARRTGADRAFPGPRRFRPPAPAAAHRRARCYTTASPRWRPNRRTAMPDDDRAHRGHAPEGRAIGALPGLRAVHHHVAVAAGRARRAEAGAPAADLRHEPAAAGPQHRLQEMRPRGRRRDRPVPPARRRGGVRRAGAPRPGFRRALPAGGRAGQFRQRRRR